MRTMHDNDDKGIEGPNRKQPKKADQGANARAPRAGMRIDRKPVDNDKCTWVTQVVAEGPGATHIRQAATDA